MEWVKNADRCPTEDGHYIVATRFDVSEMSFTTEGGWNTYRDYNGVLCNESVLSDDRIVAWMPMPPYPTELVSSMDCPSEEW